MRVLTVVQRCITLGEPWLVRMVKGLGEHCVGVAGRTDTGVAEANLGVPYQRLRTRNLLYRVLPKPLRSKSPFRPSALLANFAKSQGADRVLCNYGTVAVELEEAWDLLDLPLYIHFHGFDAMFDMREADGSGRPVHSSDYKERLLRLSQRATFLANSQFCRDRLLESGVPAEKVRVHYLGVEMPSPSEPQTPSEGRPQILYVGRFVDCKGPDRLISAFERVRDGGVDAELVMVGDGPLKPLCEALVAQSPYSKDILLAGSEPHQVVARRFRDASIFSMHSMKGSTTGQEESFGVAFLDAMAYGVPVVTGKSGGVGEIVVDGETGILFAPGDVDAHARALQSLLLNPTLAVQMGERGRQRILSNFHQPASDALLKDILAGV